MELTFRGSYIQMLIDELSYIFSASFVFSISRRIFSTAMRVIFFKYDILHIVSKAQYTWHRVQTKEAQSSVKSKPRHPRAWAHARMCLCRHERRNINKMEKTKVFFNKNIL
uniref:Uncharacterized protein n=1 Tax=Trichogramma kaykai TaxID=54128 RepID=A0ABD2WR91_9HYME